MRLAPLAAAVALVIPTLAAADPVADAGKALADAVGARDAAAVQKLFAAKVVVDSLEFRDAKCDKAFGAARKHTVAKKQRARLAACLIGDQLAAATTSTVDGLTVRYAGFDLELQVTFSSGSAPKVAKIEAAYVDVEGGVVDGDVNGVAGGVLSGDAPPPPPPPPPPAPPQIVAPTALEPNRLTGDKIITPDDATRHDIEKSGKTKVVASFKLCINTAGSVSSTSLLKSSGFPGYDKQLTAGIRSWTYRPYQVNGKAVPVCTAVTFIYSQQ